MRHYRPACQEADFNSAAKRVVREFIFDFYIRYRAFARSSIGDSGAQEQAMMALLAGIFPLFF